MEEFRCHYCGEKFFPTDEDDLLSIHLSQAMGVEDVCPECLPGQLRRELTDGARNAHMLRLTDIEALLVEAASVAGQSAATPADVAATSQGGTSEGALQGLPTPSTTAWLWRHMGEAGAWR